MLLLIPVFVAIFVALRYQRKRNLKKFGDPELIKHLMPDVSSSRPVVKFSLMMLALAGAVIIGLCFGIYRISDGKAMGRIGTAISRLTENDDDVKTFLNSPKGSIEYHNALDAIRQPYSAKIAVHEGGFFGKGPGQSTQRYVVPDISEDYMFSFIIEEYGLVGAIIIIFLYVYGLCTFSWR